MIITQLHAFLADTRIVASLELGLVVTYVNTQVSSQMRQASASNITPAVSRACRTVSRRQSSCPCPL